VELAAGHRDILSFYNILLETLLCSRFFPARQPSKIDSCRWTGGMILLHQSKLSCGTCIVCFDQLAHVGKPVLAEAKHFVGYLTNIKLRALLKGDFEVHMLQNATITQVLEEHIFALAGVPLNYFLLLLWHHGGCCSYMQNA